MCSSVVCAFEVVSVKMFFYLDSFEGWFSQLRFSALRGDFGHFVLSVLQHSLVGYTRLLLSSVKFHGNSCRRD